MSCFPIKSLAEDDRPREKMMLKGVASLSDAELLAILIGSGSRDESAVQLSQRILQSVDNNLNELAKRSVKDLTHAFKGVGEAKAITILAAVELGKRRQASDALQRPIIRCSKDIFTLFYPLLADLPHEELWIALVNRSNKLIERVKISQGSMSETTADLRIILKASILSLASGLFLCHNHPSGTIRPSMQDDQLTKRLRDAAKLFDLSLLDHVILSDNHYYSYADEGRL